MIGVWIITLIGLAWWLYSLVYLTRRFQLFQRDEKGYFRIGFWSLFVGTGAYVGIILWCVVFSKLFRMTF